MLKFRTHSKCKTLGITDLNFANDVLIFFKGDKNSVLAIRDVLHTFSSNNGLMLKSNKISLIIGGLYPSVASEFAEILNCQFENCHSNT